MVRISRPAHGVLDYVIGLFVAFSPWIFGFAQQHIAEGFAVTVGAGTILYSLLTNYELGLIRLLPFPMHKFLDICVGFVMATNWMHFRFAGTAGVFFTIVGIVEILVAIFTPQPRADEDTQYDLSACSVRKSGGTEGIEPSDGLSSVKEHQFRVP